MGSQLPGEANLTNRAGRPWAGERTGAQRVATNLSVQPARRYVGWLGLFGTGLVMAAPGSGAQ